MLLAREIVERRPDVVGLQEVALWLTGPVGDPAPPAEVRHDYLDLLMRELATGAFGQPAPGVHRV
ncbi:MAG TPA: hypothetical protein VGJ95_03250 [Pseudonocardiaceae bacterium]